MAQLTIQPTTKTVSLPSIEREFSLSSKITHGTHYIVGFQFHFTCWALSEFFCCLFYKWKGCVVVVFLNAWLHWFCRKWSFAVNLHHLAPLHHHRCCCCCCFGFWCFCYTHLLASHSYPHNNWTFEDLQGIEKWKWRKPSKMKWDKVVKLIWAEVTFAYRSNATLLHI